MTPDDNERICCYLTNAIDMLQSSLKKLKPWTLPELPPGQAWHRTDGWQQEMLPDGYQN